MNEDTATHCTAKQLRFTWFMFCMFSNKNLCILILAQNGFKHIKEWQLKTLRAQKPRERNKGSLCWSLLRVYYLPQLRSVCGSICPGSLSMVMKPCLPCHSQPACHRPTLPTMHIKGVRQSYMLKINAYVKLITEWHTDKRITNMSWKALLTLMWACGGSE